MPDINLMNELYKSGYLVPSMAGGDWDVVSAVPITEGPKDKSGNPLFFEVTLKDGTKSIEFQNRGEGDATYGFKDINSWNQGPNVTYQIGDGVSTTMGGRYRNTDRTKLPTQEDMLLVQNEKDNGLLMALASMAAMAYGLPMLQGAGTAGAVAANPELASVLSQYGPNAVGISQGATGLGSLAGVGTTGFDAAALAAFNNAASAAGWTGLGAGSSVLDKIPSALKNGAASLAKALLGDGASASDIASLAAKLIGNNAASNSVEDVINRYADRIEGLSPIDAAQRKELGNIGMEQFNTNYLTPELIGQLQDEYNDLGAKANDQYGRLAQLYDDPMSNPLMKAVSNITSENAARRSAVGRGLNAGSMPAEMQDALMASLSQNYGNIANPMNTTLNTLYQGQQVPLAALKTYNGMQNDAFTRGNQAINTGQGSQNNAATFLGNAFPYSVAMDPTRMGLSTLGSAAGSNGNVLGNALGSIGNWLTGNNSSGDVSGLQDYINDWKNRSGDWEGWGDWTGD